MFMLRISLTEKGLNYRGIVSMREDVKKELKEKYRQLREQYAEEMWSFFQKQKDEYISFFKICPQTGRSAGLFLAGLFIGMML